MSYDIFHLSYKEHYADETFKNLKYKFPWARRVQGVKGIFNAHKKCAEQAYTEMFYVVDADADLDDNFDLTYKPNKWDLDKIHVWRCRNPINDLIYGYGAVKLFPKKNLMEAEHWNIDMTTTIGAPFVPKFQISNVTAFNTDPFNTWKSAFRECTKLASAIIPNADNTDNEYRLKVWCERGEKREYGEYAMLGAQQGADFGKHYSNNIDALKLINDFDWLKEQFNGL